MTQDLHWGKSNEDIMNMREIEMYDFNSRSTIRFIAKRSIGLDSIIFVEYDTPDIHESEHFGTVKACIDFQSILDKKHDTKNDPSAAFDLTFLVERTFKASDFDDIQGPMPEDIIDNRHIKGNFPVTFRFGQWSQSHVTLFLRWLIVHWPKLIPQLPHSVSWFASDVGLRKLEYTFPKLNSFIISEGDLSLENPFLVDT